MFSHSLSRIFSHYRIGHHRCVDLMPTWATCRLRLRYTSQYEHALQPIAPSRCGPSPKMAPPDCLSGVCGLASEQIAIYLYRRQSLSISLVEAVHTAKGSWPAPTAQAQPARTRGRSHARRSPGHCCCGSGCDASVRRNRRGWYLAGSREARFHRPCHARPLRHPVPPTRKRPLAQR